MKINILEEINKLYETLAANKPIINPKMQWEYEDGLVLDGLYEACLTKENKDIKDYIKCNVDAFISDDGSILTYQVEEYNIDHLNNGKILIYLYQEYKEEKYLKALKLLYSQIKTHPRTSDHVFWHKKIYPNQIWLDGLYMGSVFYLRYLKLLGKENYYNDVVLQFENCFKHTYDEVTGLMYHAYDETKSMYWANPETGCSRNFWLRSNGWYLMGLIDIIDELPQDVPGYQNLITIFTILSDALVKYQDPSSKLWYQVIDKHDEATNYLEASGSAMVLYALKKAQDLNIYHNENLDLNIALENYLKYFITYSDKGHVIVNKICYVAGLGGFKYRDGSYSYYISEPIVSDDNKGVGAYCRMLAQYLKEEQ